MKKYIRKHIKDEKRIIKLMYVKGMFEVLNLEIKNLGWEEFKTGKRTRKRKDKIYSYKDYIPELFEFTTDYWGELNENGVVESMKDYLYYELATGINEETGWPTGSKYFNNSELIKYLLKLPFKKKDSKINYLLKIIQC